MGAIDTVNGCGDIKNGQSVQNRTKPYTAIRPCTVVRLYAFGYCKICSDIGLAIPLLLPVTRVTHLSLLSHLSHLSHPTTPL